MSRNTEYLPEHLRKTNILGIFIDENTIFINENTTSLEHLRKTNILGIFIDENTTSPEHFYV
jgi:hypothetical protein